jgi:putative membrane protein insertion efficiency factor
MNARPSAPARTLLRAIDWYQRAAEGRPSPCRFTPSCSEYAREAVERYGAGRGGWLAVRRLGRCRPFGKSGFDPVPEPCDHSPEPLSSSSAHHPKVT